MNAVKIAIIMLVGAIIVCQSSPEKKYSWEEPLEGFEGEIYSYYIYEFDDESNTFRRSFYDDSGNLTNLNRGYAYYVWMLDDRENIIECKYYDFNDVLVEDKKSGCAIQKNKYDENNKVIEIRCYGVDEKLKKDAEYGIAISKAIYDGKGNELETAFYGPDEIASDLGMIET